MHIIWDVYLSLDTFDCLVYVHYSKQWLNWQALHTLFLEHQIPAVYDSLLDDFVI